MPTRTVAATARRRSPDEQPRHPRRTALLQRRGLLRLRRQAPPLVRHLRRLPRAGADRPLRPRPQPRHRVQGRLSSPSRTPPPGRARCAARSSPPASSNDRSSPGGRQTIRVQTPALTDESTKVTAVHREARPASLRATSASRWSARFGVEITKRALQGLAVFLVLVVIFLSAFSSGDSPVAAVVALLHDLLITIGIYA